MTECVWILSDAEEGTIISVHKTEGGARAALVEFLKTRCGYDSMDWNEFAYHNGYDSVEDFQSTMLFSDKFDDYMYMNVDCCELKA